MKRGGFGGNQEVLMTFVCLQSIVILELLQMRPGT